MVQPQLVRSGIISKGLCAVAVATDMAAPNGLGRIISQSSGSSMSAWGRYRVADPLL
jgi:hypothetical protein